MTYFLNFGKGYWERFPVSTPAFDKEVTIVLKYCHIYLEQYYIKIL